ncbi:MULTISPECIES: energy-coupling factor ABC transporter ATP-binding protein [Aliagarivorans]|uniref:energy-coupling factor ABC transporter ATP-binding protein n=1 Tax=Aliagarivorans TaxID=882379 RepID=UPI000686BCF3|nr:MULTISPECIES: ABC transporter ATP-binding protein [Aliagarivorans]
MNSTTRTDLPADGGLSIKLHELSLSIEGKTILDNLTLDAQVKRLGVVGRNGSGKSSLSRVLSGLVEAKSGELLVDGFNPFKDRKAALRGIGLLFQNPDHQIIFPTVLEEVVFGLRQLGQSKQLAKQNALATLAAFGKEHWQDAHVASLSGGQKHLVCLMAVMAMQPSLIILDEPFAGLDIPTKKQLTRYLSQFPGSLIHISHDPDDLAGYEQMLWLEGGKIAAFGASSEVLPAYLARMHKIGDGDDISQLAG